nr:divalent metal cation transporter [Actinomycetota bacterium]
MSKAFKIMLGVLTAIGGFVDIGDLVANVAVGARFKLALAWVVVVGVVGICVYAEMAGRVAAVSGRAVFDLVRERLGPGAGLANLLASFFINFLTLTAELAGVAIAVSLATSVNYLFLLPVAAFLVWVVIWRLPFEKMENLFGLMGLSLIVTLFAVVRIGPDWGQVLHGASHPSIGSKETIFSYAYYGIALFGAAMTPYEVFFFSSGAVEEDWDKSDLALERANVFIGFPLGGVLSIALMVGASLILAPRDISVGSLAQVALPTAAVLGRLGLAVLLLGIFAATFGAALETALSAGYTVSQYLGWQWGKFVKPADAPRFHLVVLLSIAAGMLFAISGVDPVKVTEYSIVLSAAALPLTYFPILVIANDRDYMGDEVNGRFANALAFTYLVIIVV